MKCTLLLGDNQCS